MLKADSVKQNLDIEQLQEHHTYHQEKEMREKSASWPTVHKSKFHLSSSV